MKFRFDFVEPFITSLSRVFDLIVWDSDVFEKHSNSLRKPSDSPIAQCNFSFLHILVLIKLLKFLDPIKISNKKI